MNEYYGAVDCPFCGIGELVQDGTDINIGVAHCTVCLDEITTAKFRQLQTNISEAISG